MKFSPLASASTVLAVVLATSRLSIAAESGVLKKTASAEAKAAGTAIGVRDAGLQAPLHVLGVYPVSQTSTTTTKHNVAYDPRNTDLAGTDVAIANFDFHTTERKAYIGSGAIETSSKPDRLLIGGMTRSRFINHP